MEKSYPFIRRKEAAHGRKTGLHSPCSSQSSELSSPRLITSCSNILIVRFNLEQKSEPEKPSQKGLAVQSHRPTLKDTDQRIELCITLAEQTEHIKTTDVLNSNRTNSRTN